MKQLENHKLIHKNKMIAERNLSAIISFLVLVSIDQLTKYIVIQNMALYESVPLIKGVFEIHYIQNPGAAWGMFANRRLLFTVCTVIIFVIGITVYYKCIQLEKYNDIRILLIFILAGGLGNFIDRMRYEYVIDFLYFKLINFPVFNIADCYVTVGFILLLLIVFFKYKEEDFEDLFSQKR